MKSFLLSIEVKYPTWIRDATPETRALFFLGLHKLSGRPKHLKLAREAFHQALAHFPISSERWGLLDSPAQTLWLANLLGENTALQSMLFEAKLKRELKRLKNPDSLYGLVGLGKFLQALPARNPLRSHLPQVIAQIKSLRQSPGVWRDFEIKSHINLGFAHGLPSLVPLFVAAKDTAEVTPLLETLRGFQSDPYPSRARPLEYARQAWCYGAPGVALAFAAAKKSREAARLFEAGSAHARTQLDDPFLCHGSAGLALIAYVLKSKETDEWMKRTYEELRTLKMKRGPANLLTSPLGAALVLIMNETGWTEWAEPMLVPKLRGSGSRAASSAKRSPGLRRRRKAGAD